MMEFDLLFHVLEKVKEKPVLIVMNKCENHDFIDKQGIEMLFNLPDLLSQYPNLNVIYASALQGNNCSEIYLWV